MNDDQHSAHSDAADLVASARLDGEPEVDGGSVDPAVVERHQQALQAVVDRLREPVALPAGDVIDDQIARAVATLDADADAVTATDDDVGDEPVAAVVPLAAARSRAKGRHRWLAAAAAVAVALVIAGAVAVTNRPHTSTFDTVAAPVGETTASTASTAAGASRSAAADASPSSTSPPAGSSAPADTLPDLGAIASEEALSAEVKTQDPALMTTSEPTTGPTTTAVVSPPSSTTSTTASLAPLRAPVPPATCDAAVRASTPGLGTLVYAATAMYQGVAIEVLVYQSGAPPSYRLIGAQTGTCAVLVDRAL